MFAMTPRTASAPRAPLCSDQLPSEQTAGPVTGGGKTAVTQPPDHKLKPLLLWNHIPRLGSGSTLTPDASAALQRHDSEHRGARDRAHQLGHLANQVQEQAPLQRRSTASAGTSSLTARVTW